MKDELFIKEINGNKVYCLEYDKETLKDMVIEKQEENEELKSIINKAIEYIEYYLIKGKTKNHKQFETSILEILDKEV